MPETKAKPRQRTAKGRRPFFLDNPESDKLLAMVIALVQEVSVVRDRLDAHEQLARAGKVATPEEVDAYEPDDDVEDARETRRAALLERVFRIIAIKQDEPADGADPYEALVDQFANDDKTAAE
jgi:hypothetical protein